MITVYKKKVRQAFKKARVVVSGFDNQFDADLADMYLTYPRAPAFGKLFINLSQDRIDFLFINSFNHDASEMRNNALVK
jgi:hypothetical protein